MSHVKTLHDEDFVAWSKEQAEALRAEAAAGSNQKLDWANLAEEIESLGFSEKRELHSQIQRIILHLLKLQHSPATEPRRAWDETVGDARNEVELLLEASPSLAGEIKVAIEVELKRAARKAIRDFEKYGELDPVIAARIRGTTYTEEQILGDWLPPEPLD